MGYPAMFLMKKQTIGILVCILVMNLVIGCGGENKWKPFLGYWTMTTSTSDQLEIKTNGDYFLATTFQKTNFFGYSQDSFVVKPQGETLVLANQMGGQVPIIYDKASDMITLNGLKYRRQTPDDAKKLEEMQKKK